MSALRSCSWQSDGALEGHLSSANRRGAEKARCVQAMLAEHKPLYSHAYGTVQPISIICDWSVQALT